MRAGPKAAPSGAPLPLHLLPAGGAARVIAFVEDYCRVVKGGTGNPAGAPLRLRPWQKKVLIGLYDPEPRPRQALVSVARKNGKSLLASSVALYHLLADGEESAEVVIISTDERTSRVIFNMARRMVELDERLSGVLQVFADRLVHPATDSVLESLPAEPSRLQGRNPSAVIADEVAFMDADGWDALALAGGTRARPLVLGISTAALTADTLMGRLTAYGRDVEDPAFYFAEYAAPAGCDLLDRDAWAAANPMLGDTLDPAHLAAMAKTTRPEQFRRFHLNQTVGLSDTWMPAGAWASCSAPGTVPDGAEVVISLDGSFSQDATALVVATVSPRPHLDVAGLWEPPNGDPDFRVPVADVEEAIRTACRRWQVREVVADPFRWTRTLQALTAEGLPMVELPQSPQRMTPATTGLYEAVVNRQVTHSGDPDLARHVGNATIRDDARGTRLAKDRARSTRRIDLAVCAVMAHYRATWHASRTQPKKRVLSW